MKTAMSLALARIEMLYGNKDDIHWEMFKNDCMDKEKSQIIEAHADGSEDLNFNGEITERGLKNANYYYNQTYNQEAKKEYQPSEEYLKKQRDNMEDFIWNRMNKNNQNK